MAQKIVIHLIDDLDGSTAEDTVHFGLDGAQYEIDLNHDHATELRMILVRYAGAGRKIASPAWPRARNDRSGSANGLSTSELRDWARAHGIEVKRRGRVSAELTAKFQAFVRQQAVPDRRPDFRVQRDGAT